MGGCPDVGVGGLTLGGGENFLMASYGAVCDNVLAAEIVTADGRALTLSADDHADLFWAIRGGGGNFGIVTSFDYRLHPVVEVLSGMLLFPVSRVRETLRRYRDLMGAVPDALETSGGLTFRDGQPVFFIALCHCGGRRDGESVVHHWQTVLRSESDTVGWSPYSADLVVPAAPSTGTGVFLPALPDEVIDLLAAAMAQAPESATATWNDFHGAVTRVPRDAMAFPLRERGFDLFISAPWHDDEASRRAALAWVHGLRDALAPFGRGVYVNNLDADESHRIPDAYGSHYDRLAATKAIHDPDNVFRVNHNIPPAGSSSPDHSSSS
jgi:FAD/FMN-containing dehydrogenase